MVAPDVVSDRGFRVVRVLFAIVAVAAGTAGVVMVVAPDDTDRYFSWPIGPPPLAALVGAFYVASAVVFGRAAAREDWAGSRGLCFGVLALTLPTLVATTRHRDVFDFGRWQAVAWVALFIASPIAYGTILVLQRGRVVGAGARLPRLVVLAAVIEATAYAALALGLWVAPSSLEGNSPFALPGLSGRFLGCWAAFLAVLAAFVALRNRWNEARTPLLALTLWPAGALFAAFRSWGDLAPSERRAGYVAAAVVLTVVGAGMLAASRSTAGSSR
ncbi:MAG: hypothetical protein ACRDWD_05830 [Acidimicrobiia bacterium]